MSVISTPITELFGIKHPILLAGVPLLDRFFCVTDDGSSLQG
jgi:hypothetical protein